MGIRYPQPAITLVRWLPTKPLCRPLGLVTHLGLSKKIAEMYIAMGSSQQALELYEQINQTSSNDYVKAQMDLLIGQTYLARGESALAYEKFLHAVENYPLSFDSYSALVALVEAGIPVSDLDRGLVDYYAGQYGLALGALDRYLQNLSPKTMGPSTITGH